MNATFIASNWNRSIMKYAKTDSSWVTASEKIRLMTQSRRTAGLRRTSSRPALGSRLAWRSGSVSAHAAKGNLIAAHNTVTQTFDAVNAKLAEELAPREFVALCLARYDTASRSVEIANAGLPDPYLMREGANAEAIVVPGERLPLGARSATSYTSRTLSLAPGDRLLMLTDGLPEALTSAGEPLGYTALEALLDHAASSPSEWLDRLLERHEATTVDGLQDDLTALVLQTR